MVLVVDFRVSSLIHVDIIIKDFSEALVSVSTCLRSRASMSLTGLVRSSIGSVTSMVDSHPMYLVRSNFILVHGTNITGFLLISLQFSGGRNLFTMISMMCLV